MRQSDRFYNSKFYPVDYDRKLIYNDPQRRVLDCDLNSATYRELGTVGIRGSRLNNFPTVYAAFTLVAVPVATIYREANGKAAAVDNLSFELHGDALISDAPPLRRDIRGIAGILVVNNHWGVTVQEEDLIIWVPLILMPNETCSGETVIVHAEIDRNGMWQPVRVSAVQP